jgi:light-regulated signal transduction histidine kinase (bacteriophytochrome)
LEDAQKIADLEQELQQVKEEYSKFCYLVSHDLKACLRSIDGFSSLIAKKHAEEFDDETLKYFNRIIANADHAKEILTQLSKYAHTDDQKTSFIEYNSNMILEEVKESLSTLIKTNQAKINCAPLPTIIADAGQLTAIFYHLLHNALYYQPDGQHPDIYITCEDKNDAWQFAIKDNGIGVKENIFDSIFDALRRGVSNKKYPDGLGMGLAFAKKLVKRHQGKIWLESKVNEGSTFYFTISKDLKAT